MLKILDIIFKLIANFFCLSTGSPLRGLISNAIIQLNEKGFIANLKNRWWKRERGGGTCSVSEEKK